MTAKPFAPAPSTFDPGQPLFEMDPHHVLDRGEVIELFRNRVLEVLDDAARECFGFVVLPRNGVGATDADLPDLFKTIDAQVDRVARRCVNGSDPRFSDWYATWARSEP